VEIKAGWEMNLHKVAWRTRAHWNQLIIRARLRWAARMC